MQRNAADRLGVLRESELPRQKWKRALSRLLLAWSDALGSRPPGVIHTVSRLDEAFAQAVDRAALVRELGFDIGFSFLPRYPDAPHFYLCAGRHGEEHGLGSGFDLTSPASAFSKALSEVLERSLWRDQTAYYREGSISSSVREMTEPHFELDRLAGFSDDQRKRSAALQFDADAKFLWTPGTRLDDGTKMYVPAQLVSSRHARELQGQEPLLRISNSNGLSTGTTFEEAAYRGLQELIERDAFMIAFYNRMTPARIDPGSILDAETRTFLRELERYELACDLVLIPTDMPSAVVCAIIRDPSGKGPAFALGAKAHHDPEEAMRGALTESYGTWHITRLFGLYTKPLRMGNLSLHERLAYWGKPEHAEKLRWLVDGPVAPLPAASDADNVRSLAKAAHKHGCTALAVEMSTPTLKQLGIHSVCVASPELQPLYLDSEPYRGGARLKKVPEKLGFKAAENPPPYPHPFP